MKRIITNLTDGFYFKKIDNENISPEEAIASFDGGRAVRIPHDYAIEGDFDINNDPVYRADGTLEHTGRTGGLPIVGTGVYTGGNGEKSVSVICYNSSRSRTEGIHDRLHKALQRTIADGDSEESAGIACLGFPERTGTVQTSRTERN